jgi:CBS domain containing-hemolysin-like protein
VVDEYGGIEGLLIDHDILEAIAGEDSLRGQTDRPQGAAAP